MEEHRLENYLRMPELDLAMNEDEATITYISFPMYQIRTVDPMLFCVDTGAPNYCISEKALERIFRFSGRRSNLIIDSKCDLKFGDTLIRSKDMVELMLPTPGFKPDIQVILDLGRQRDTTTARIRRFRRNQPSCRRCNKSSSKPYYYRKGSALI